MNWNMLSALAELIGDVAVVVRWSCSAWKCGTATRWSAPRPTGQST